MTEIINTIPGESENLALHVQLCEQRYIQLLNKFDSVDSKFEKLEDMLLEIKDTIKGDERENTSRYLRWAGAIISVLSTIVIGLVTHLLFK